MFHLKLILAFFRVTAQAEMAYRVNFWIHLLNSGLNLLTGVLSLVVIFNQVETIRGWDLSGALALLGVYLLLRSLQDLFIGPSLESVVGMDGEIWTGNFDFTLLRPVSKQFLLSFQQWRVFALLDLLLALGVLVYSISLLGASFTIVTGILFFLSLLAGLTLMYAALLAFSALAFFNSGFLFTWVFNDMFQLARYPVGLYPGWLRLVLTWIIPVGLMTTVPAQALTGDLSPVLLAGVLVFSLAALVGASWLFRLGLRRYTSASS